jgi:ABC-type lipoprotein release transport system permease subunit
MNPDLKIPIHSIREESVILGSELAKLYGVGTGSLNQTIARNPKRFPKDFSFVLNR